MQKEQLLKPGLSASDGVVTGVMTHDRLIVLPARFWTEAKLFLERAYGDSVNLVLNKFAQEVGRSYGELMRGNGLKPAEAFEAMAELASVAGWGRVEVSGDVRGGSDVRVEITNCVFCSAGAAARGGRCDFIAGVAEGLAKATYGHEYRTGHVDAGVGAETKCTILVSRTSHPDGEWKASVFFPWMMSKDGAP